MFLDSTQKKSKTKALEQLMGRLDEMDGEKFSKGKKPIAAEVSVTEVIPKDGEEESGELEEYMGKAGHEGVEAAEEKMFPAEEASEEQGMISPEEKAKIEELYNRYCK